MSASRPSSNRRPSSRRAKQQPGKTSRAQLIFGVVSALVICSMVGGVFVGLTYTDLFGGLFSDQSDEENYANPNSDLIEAQQTVVANNPDDVEDVLLLANILANSGRLGEAIPLYEHVLDLSPDDVSARLNFARALADGGMAADAELQFNLVLEADPGNQQAHYYLAELLVADQPSRTDQAIPHYRRAMEIDPTTLIGERSQTQLDVLGAGTPASASPDAATPGATPAGP